jgi:hypothetical protein
MRLNYVGRRTALAMAAIAILVIVLHSMGARAQSYTLEGLARVVSTYTIVDKLCSIFIPVDRDVTQKLIVDVLDIGAKRFGLSETRAAVKVEMERRSAEVGATGTEQWCSYQRDHLKAIGMGWLFKG